MFSYWIGRLVKKDLRQVGDGNPGAFNLWHAAGPGMGLLGVFLDFSKGYFPLVVLLSGGYAKGMAIVPVAIAPILGHAFSPFLKGRGGKGIAVSFGVWSAVTRFEVSFVYAVILAVFLVAAKFINRGKSPSTEANAFMVTAGMLTLGLYLFYRGFHPHIFALWIGNLLILAYKNSKKLYKFSKRFSKAVFEEYQQEDKESPGW